jgi:hypothetical protein
MVRSLALVLQQPMMVLPPKSSSACARPSGQAQRPARSSYSGSALEPFLRVPGSFTGPMEDHCHEISLCDCDSCFCRWCRAGGLFCRLAAPRKAVHADRHPIGGPISSVCGSVFASVRWLTAGATQNALAALLPQTIPDKRLRGFDVDDHGHRRLLRIREKRPHHRRSAK